MSDSTDDQAAPLSPAGYAGRWAFARARIWKKHANAAEWAATQLPHGGLILQQRRRARSANLRAFWVLVMLVAVVFLGLGYYIVPEVLERISDGRRAAAQEAIDLADADSKALNAEREAIRAEMRDASALVFERFDTGIGYWLTLSLELKGTGTLIVAGEDGAVFRSTDDGTTWTRAETGTEASLYTSLEIKGTNTLIVAGSGGTILRSTDDGATWSRAETGTNAWVQFLLELKGTGTLIVAGEDGTVLRSTDDGTTWTRAETGTEASLYSSLEMKGTNTLIVTGTGGTILRSTDDGATWTRAETGTEASLYSSLELKGTNTLIVTGRDGTILRSTDGGATWKRAETGTDSWLRAPLKLKGTNTLIVTGSAGTILRSTDDGATWTRAETGTDTRLFSSLELKGTNTLIVTGHDGTILRSTDDGATWTRAETGTEASLYTSLEIKGTNTLIVTGGEGTILRSTDDGTTWTSFATGARSPLGLPFVIERTGTTIVHGGPGVLRGTRDYLDSLDGIELADSPIQASSDGDAELLAFIDTLPSHVQVAAPFPGIRLRLTSLVAQRGIIDGSRERALGRLAELDDGTLSTKERQDAFSAFMNTCRGQSAVSETDAACAQAWTADQEATREGWWDTLTRQGPVGILLIFLLALLGGLYRYSLRMAGFHASRADALELLAKNIVTSDVEKLERLANTLAADKVEFKDSRTPADQAVEIAKAINARA